MVTTSFHGTVFSVINEVPFLTLKFSNEIDLRSEFFLKNIGLYSRMLQSQKEVKSVGLDVNFVSSNKKLSLLRLESINYLKEYLGVDYE